MRSIGDILDDYTCSELSAEERRKGPAKPLAHLFLLLTQSCSSAAQLRRRRRSWRRYWENDFPWRTSTCRCPPPDFRFLRVRRTVLLLCSPQRGVLAPNLPPPPPKCQATTASKRKTRTIMMKIMPTTAITLITLLKRVGGDKWEADVVRRNSSRQWQPYHAARRTSRSCCKSGTGCRSCWARTSPPRTSCSISSHVLLVIHPPHRDSRPGPCLLLRQPGGAPALGHSPP